MSSAGSYYTNKRFIPPSDATRASLISPPDASRSADEIIARALIQGRLPIKQALQQLTYSNGLPVWTANNTVIFIHRSHETRLRWAVMGDFNGWHPTPMRRTKHRQLWYAEIPMHTCLRGGFGYKYVASDGREIADPWARYFSYDNNWAISYLVAPLGRQHLVRFNAFESPQGLRERALNILVPPNDGPYDVLYAHDGQNLFSPDSIGGGWHLCENMRKIHGNFLIVGIFNTEDRLREYTHEGDMYFGRYQDTLGNKYADFVEHSVRPFIESHFLTTKKAGLLGSSLGGLISLYISNRFPNRYSAVYALSPTTAWGRFCDDHGTTIRDYYEQTGHQNTFIYIDHGGEFPTEGVPDVLDHRIAQRDESDWSNPYDNCCYTFDFASALAEIGYRQNIDMMYRHVPGAAHSESAWAARVCKPLRMFMNGNVRSRR